MSQAAAELLILYKTEAKQWATYLQSVFTGLISEAGICLYDIAGVSGRREEFLRLAHYTCKLLILSRDLLEGLCQVQRFFLARVLSPASNVVVLLCGVDSMTPLLELVPLNGNECLQISSEQDVHEYLSTVTEIVRKGVSPTAANVKASTHKPPGSQQEVKISPLNGASSVRSSIVVVPSRVACRSAVEVFILLRNEALGDESDIEFTGKNLTVRVTPVRWNNQSLCINAPDFPAGNVDVTVYSNGVPLGKAQLQYYSSMQEIAHLLQSVAQPVEFMCQALQVSSLEKLDQKLASMLLQTMPTGGFQGLHCTNTPERELHRTDVPSLLHFAAQFDFKSVSSVLLQCPGAERALHTANRHGETAAEIAKSHGHAELHVLLKETLASCCYVAEVQHGREMFTRNQPSGVRLKSRCWFTTYYYYYYSPFGLSRTSRMFVIVSIQVLTASIIVLKPHRSTSSSKLQDLKYEHADNTLLSKYSLKCEMLAELTTFYFPMPIKKLDSFLLK
ncbi:B-cell scaffold protein with ankyrin repeats [Channa argus]|uniref:B-cell scaffold protein with ankyrin repeats n=1 Tax=Channa argus TaxID=215402 RepID=A0A6G1Q5W4_CHAAH|nr:B-cell scaffold protein with ankyrin repeats [Channa argus]